MHRLKLRLTHTAKLEIQINDRYIFTGRYNPGKYFLFHQEKKKIFKAKEKYLCYKESIFLLV